MNPEVRRAHASTLLEWADQYVRSAQEGDTEVVYLLRRLARLLTGEREVETYKAPAIEEPPAEAESEQPLTSQGEA